MKTLKKVTAVRWYPLKSQDSFWSMTNKELYNYLQILRERMEKILDYSKYINREGYSIYGELNHLNKLQAKWFEVIHELRDRGEDI